MIVRNCWKSQKCNGEKKQMRKQGKGEEQQGQDEGANDYKVVRTVTVQSLLFALVSSGAHERKQAS